MDDVLLYLVPTNELAQRAVQSASNRSLRYRGIREGLVLRIPLPEPNSLRQSPEKTDFLSFGTQPDNRVVLPGLVAALIIAICGFVGNHGHGCLRIPRPKGLESLII